MDIRNKKVLVTGADGFIGSHLVEELVNTGMQVKAFCCYNSFNSLGWLDSFSKEKLAKINVLMGDIRDPHGVKEALKDVDMVFHLAALIGIPFSYYSPEAYFDTNIKGTLNVLQASRGLDIEKILVTSTSEVYGTALYVPVDEKHPKQGQSPYSASKIGADFLSESFYRSFDLPVTIVRPFNTYGPRQSARAIIPTIITQVLLGQKEIRLGSLHPKRDLVFVRDTVAAFLKIAQSDNVVGEEINIATETEISIGELARKICDILNSNAQIVMDEVRVRPEKSEVDRLLGSCKKIQKLVGWKPSYTLDKGLEETITWFKEGKNAEKYKPHRYNI